MRSIVAKISASQSKYKQTRKEMYSPDPVPGRQCLPRRVGRFVLSMNAPPGQAARSPGVLSSAQARQLKAPGWDALPPLIGLEMFHDAALWIAKVQGKKRCGGQLSSPTRQILVATAASKHTIWSHKN